MRVHFLGNTCNGNFDVARAMREQGVDAHLFLPPLHRDAQTLPEAADPSLAGNYPPWIHRMEDPIARLRPLGFAGRRARAELEACDVIHTHGDYATWVMRGKTPYVIQPFGGDFFLMPFGRKFGRTLTKWKDFVPDPRWFGFPRQLREAYRRASAIILSNVDHLWERGYALIRDRPIAMIGLAMDTATFAPGADTPPATVTELRRDHDLILFQPTRQIWTETGRRGEGGYSYGNDVFLRGVAQANRAGARVGVILVDKASLCTGATKALIRELGLEADVRWVPVMPRHQLVAYYRSVDLSVDAFYAGGFGSAALEAMACARPVLMYLDDAANAAIYGEVPPTVNARTADEIAAQLQRPLDLAGLGARSRAFVERHHARAAVIPRYRAVYERVLGRTDAIQFVPPDVYLGLRSPLPPTRAM